MYGKEASNRKQEPALHYSEPKTKR